MFFDIRYSITYSTNLFCLVIRNRDTEFFFEFHDKFYSVKRICSQVVSEPASLVVMYSGGLTQKKVIQFCDYLNINDFKKIKTIKTELSNNPTISYINQDNQEKQYEFYIMSQKGDIKVTIVILKNNIIKILDDENHQVHYYQSQNINYEKLNIDHLPW